jgi:hypothetical protein
VVPVLQISAYALWWLKLAAGSGLLMTLLYISLSVVPSVQVESRLAFALKIGGLIIVTNILGLVIYLVMRKRTVARG